MTNLPCRSCGKPLVEYETWGDPRPPFEIVAKCPHCGDESWPVAIATQFAYGGATVPDDDEPDGRRPVTQVVRVDPVGSTRTFTVKPC